MVDAGQMALVIASLAASYATVASFLGALKGKPQLVLSGRYAFYTVPVLLLVSSLAVVYAFINDDFSVR